jgi:diaminopimelate epimerase
MALKQDSIGVTKFHGLGNDFIVTADRRLPRRLPELARAICAQHTGLGADGFITVASPRKKTADARIRIFNADGGEAEMSGNGIRCVGAFLALRASRQRQFQVETAAGMKTLDLIAWDKKRAWRFRVAMGQPILGAAQIPFKGKLAGAPVVCYPLETVRGVLPVTITSMGNPHCSVFVGDFAALDWKRVGQEIERHPLFPNRTNVEFVKVLSPRQIEVRFWERGVGQTMSSGTGSSAATVAAILNGHTQRKVRVKTLAGHLDIAWPEGGEVILTGPACKIADATYYLA